jgi:hypothetical protein
VASLYRALARAAGLPERERPEERLLVVESAQHRISRRLVRARDAQAVPGQTPQPVSLQRPGPGVLHGLRAAKQRRARSSACCPRAGLLTRGGGGRRQDDGAEALAELAERDLLLAYLFPSKAAGPLGGGQEVHVFHKCAPQGSALGPGGVLSGCSSSAMPQVLRCGGRVARMCTRP